MYHPIKPCMQIVIRNSEPNRPRTTCGRPKDEPIHPPGAYLFEPGEIGDHIPHAFYDGYERPNFSSQVEPAPRVVRAKEHQMRKTKIEVAIRITAVIEFDSIVFYDLFGKEIENLGKGDAHKVVAKEVERNVSRQGIDFYEYDDFNIYELSVESIQHEEAEQ